MSKQIKGKTEAGQEGKLGHSNMAYWGETDEARKHRRLEIPQVNDRDLEEWVDEEQSDGQH